MASSSGDVVSGVPTMPATQPHHQSIDWTQLPEGCRMLLLKHMDDATRTAWRATCSLTRRDVHASTRTLTRRSDISSDDLRRQPITALPAALIASLPNLQNLVCDSVPELTSIQGIPTSLRSLDLTFCYRLNSLTPLLHCTALQEVMLIVTQWEGQAAVLPQVMAALSSSLRKLRLDVQEASQAACDSHVIDEAMRSLEPLTGLQELAVFMEPLRETAWQTLARMVGQMPGLTALHLMYGSVHAVHGFDCLSTLAPALRQLSQLQSLILEDSRSDNDSCFALADALASLPATLTHLDMGRIVINEDDAPALAAALRAHSATLRTITLRNSDAWTLLAPGLGACSSLTALDLGDCEISTSDGAALATALAGSATSLTSLSLSSTCLGEKSTAALASVLSRMTDLELLDYRANRLGPAGALVLAPALSHIGPSLTFLDICGNDIGCDGAIALAPALRSMSSLVSFSCAFCGVGPAGATALAAALPSIAQLRHFDLSDNSIGLRGLKALAGGLQALPGGQQWELLLDKKLVQEGALRPCNGSKAIAAIVNTLACVSSWKVQAADTYLTSMMDRACRVFGLTVTF